MIPKYLFHYTSLEGLKSIIKSKNIRFTRIDKLNDPYDGSIPVSNVPFKKTYFAKTTYVSCWTSQEKESISLWDLYTKMKGFRLKMKSSLFSKNMVLKESKNMIIPISNISEIDSGFNLSNQQEENVKIKKIHGPVKISYIEDLKNINKNSISEILANKGTEKEFEQIKVEFGEMGFQKIHYWDFENEWRYKINLYGGVFIGKEAFINLHMNRTMNSPKYIDVPFEEDILNDIEILIAPCTEDLDIDSLKIFLSKNNIKCKIEKSDIELYSK